MKPGEQKEEQDLGDNIHFLMDDMKKDIMQIYKIVDEKNDMQQREGKEVIEVLQVSNSIFKVYLYLF